jgi:hypothetical protein
LADVEHAQDREVGAAFFLAVLVLGLLGGVAENLDRPLALADLSSALLPLPESGDAGGVGALRQDQQNVAEAVAVESGGEREESRPSFGAG